MKINWSLEHKYFVFLSRQLYNSESKDENSGRTGFIHYTILRNKASLSKKKVRHGWQLSRVVLVVEGLV